MRFIVIDGMDGAGKDTHALMLKKKCRDCGQTVILRSHPESDNIYGRKAKDALLGKGKFNKITASVFYAIDVIRSVYLYHGKADNVIFVRYLFGVAYLPYPLAKLLYKFFSLFLPTSDYMFFLDLKPDKALKRISKRDDQEIFENLDDLMKVREKIKKLSSGWKVINTKGSIDDVQEEMEKYFKNSV
ncbi:MAG TPA: thymidylate kinase [Methanobacterium sp.]|jgi:dTMP kinase|nr:MAG: thymidylate kinase [Methanobacterium sp.]HOI72377.1 thymidylate kinase [Methanobacterium sp.]HPX78468.1 thymidylate kinase [Methanobacterium sp.]